MRNVVFVAPYPIETTLRFVRALRGLDGLRLIGVVCDPPGGDDAFLFHDVVRVQNGLDTGQLAGAIEEISRRHGPVHRLLGILEPLQVQLAALRERFGIAGMRVATAELFRDKARMKDALRAAGLPCARHALVRSIEDARAFVGAVGYPIVVKPPAGMACKATWKIETDDQLAQAVAAVGASDRDPLLAEEFLRGREHSFDTITVGGEVKLTSVADYAPSCLEVMEHDWIQWTVVVPRESGDVGEVAALGRGAIAALGLETAMTHMEWFRRDDGSLAIGEIAARPPGAHFARMIGLAHETSMYRAWARAVVDEAFDGPFERRFAVGCAYLRGMGRGRVVAVEGVSAAQEAVGSLVVEAKLPTPGAPKNDSYEGDGHVIVRHPDTAVVREALRRVVETVRVRYG